MNGGVLSYDTAGRSKHISRIKREIMVSPSGFGFLGRFSFFVLLENKVKNA